MNRATIADVPVCIVDRRLDRAEPPTLAEDDFSTSRAFQPRLPPRAVIADGLQEVRG